MENLGCDWQWEGSGYGSSSTPLAKRTGTIRTCSSFKSLTTSRGTVLSRSIKGPLFTPFTLPLCHAICGLSICRGFLGHLRWGNCGKKWVLAWNKCTCLNANQMPCQHSWYAVQLVKNVTERDKKGGHCQNMVAPIAHSDLSDPFWWDWFSKTSFLAVTVCIPLSMIIVKHVHCDHYHDIAFWWLSFTFFRVKLIITGFNYATNILWYYVLPPVWKSTWTTTWRWGALDALLLLCDKWRLKRNLVQTRHPVVQDFKILSSAIENIWQNQKATNLHLLAIHLMCWCCYLVVLLCGLQTSNRTCATGSHGKSFHQMRRNYNAARALTPTVNPMTASVVAPQDGKTPIFRLVYGWASEEVCHSLGLWRFH